MLEQRGFVAIGAYESTDSQPSSLATPFNTLVFCIESIFATAKSVSSYNKELEEFISPEVSNILNDEWFTSGQKRKLFILVVALTFMFSLACIIKKGWLLIWAVTIFFTLLVRLIYLFGAHLKLANLKNLVNKARALSPCEDFSSNISPSLKSEIAKKGSIKLKGFGLTTMIEAAHARLENYGHFLKTCHESTTIHIAWTLTLILLVSGVGQHILSKEHLDKLTDVLREIFSNGINWLITLIL